MNVTRLDHFGIEVTDLKRAESFYTTVLGLKVRARRGHQVLIDCHNSTLALFEKQKMTPMGGGDLKDPFGKGHWAFEVTAEELLSTVEEFKSTGTPFNGPVNWGDHDCLYFLDPDGNLLEIIGRDKASAKND